MRNETNHLHSICGLKINANAQLPFELNTSTFEFIL